MDWTGIGGWVVAALTAAGGLYLNWRRAPAEARKVVGDAKLSEAAADETVGKAWAQLYGEVRTRLSANVNLGDVGAAMNANLLPGTELHSDEANAFRPNTPVVAGHRRVNHSLAYVMDGVHTNNVEGFFSVLKRGLRGVYQHWDPQHTGRYVDEFSFRHNRRTTLGWNDGQRAGALVKGASGKRLSYAALVGRVAEGE